MPTYDISTRNIQYRRSYEDMKPPSRKKYQDLVATEEKVPGSISPSPHELHEVYPMMED